MFPFEDTLFYIGLTVASFVMYETIRIIIYSQKAVSAGRRVSVVVQKLPNAQTRILVIGDSTSFGTGSTKPENSLVGRLARDFPHADIVNASENAMNCKRLAEKLSHMHNQHFDLVMIHIGGIDTITFTTTKMIKRSFGEVHRSLTAMSVATVVLVSMNNVGSVPLFRFPLSILYDTRSKKLTELFTKICAECNFVHLPLYEEHSNDPLLLHTENTFSDDSIHPNDIGYGIWYEKIKQALKAHISQKHD